MYIGIVAVCRVTPLLLFKLPYYRLVAVRVATTWPKMNLQTVVMTLTFGNERNAPANRVLEMVQGILGVSDVQPTTGTSNANMPAFNAPAFNAKSSNVTSLQNSLDIARPSENVSHITVVPM